MIGPSMAAESQNTLAPHICRLLFTLGALGEIGVGVVVFAFPQVLAFLMAVRLDDSGLAVARMLASAALALGVTWWIAWRDAALLSGYAAGFIVYNAGVGAVFALAAVAAARPALPWLVCVAHLLLAVGFGAAVAATPRTKANDDPPAVRGR